MPRKKNDTTEDLPEVGINISLPNDLHRAIRVRAIENGQTLRDAIIEAAELWLK